MKTLVRHSAVFALYGNTTFRFETDAQGQPMVHRVNGQHRDEHYYTSNTLGAIFSVATRSHRAERRRYCYLRLLDHYQ